MRVQNLLGPGIFVESDGGGADGWTARVYAIADGPYGPSLAEGQGNTRVQAVKAAVRAYRTREGHSSND